MITNEWLKKDIMLTLSLSVLNSVPSCSMMNLNNTQAWLRDIHCCHGSLSLHGIVEWGHYKNSGQRNLLEICCWPFVTFLKIMDLRRKLDRLNKVNDRIQFTCKDAIEGELSLLYTRIKSSDNSVTFRSYRKPTNKNNLTQFFSAQWKNKLRNRHGVRGTSLEDLQSWTFKQWEELYN